MIGLPKTLEKKKPGEKKGVTAAEESWLLQKEEDKKVADGFVAKESTGLNKCALKKSDFDSPFIELRINLFNHINNLSCLMCECVYSKQSIHVEARIGTSEIVKCCHLQNFKLKQLKQSRHGQKGIL